MCISGTVLSVMMSHCLRQLSPAQKLALFQSFEVPCSKLLSVDLLLNEPLSAPTLSGAKSFSKRFESAYLISYLLTKFEFQELLLVQTTIHMF